MLSEGGEIYISIPGDSHQRRLYRGSVISSVDGGFVAGFEDSIHPQAGKDVFIFYNFGGKFYKQSARVKVLMTTQPSPVIAFAQTSTAMLDDGRDGYRVCVDSDQVIATIDDAECEVYDISTAGLSISTAKQYITGVVVKVVMGHEAESFSGNAVVKSVEEFQPDRYRYGILAIDDESGGDLKQGLQQITSAIQREQVRRVVGAG